MPVGPNWRAKKAHAERKNEISLHEKKNGVHDPSVRRVVQYSDKFLHSIELYCMTITIV